MATQLEQLRYAEAFRQFPELTHSIENEINQRTQAYQQQVSQAFEHANTAVHAVRGAVLSKYPELQGVKSDQDLMLALNVIQQSNPQRYAEVARDLQHMADVVGNAQKVALQHNANQALRQQQEFENYRKAEVEAFELRNPEFFRPGLHGANEPKGR